MMKRQTLIILAVLCMMALPAAANDVGNATIRIGDGSGYVTMPITVTNATNIGTVDVTLRYDPTVVNVTHVAKGDMSSMFSNVESATDGWVRIGAFQVGNGLNGAFILANVRFEPVGSSGSCPLEISVNEYVEASPIYNAMPYTVSNGTYTLVSEESDDGDDGRDDGRDGDRYAWYLYEDHDGKNVTEENTSANATAVETPTAPPLKNLPGEDELHDEDNDDEDQNSLWWIVITIVCLIIVAAVTRSKMRSRNDDDGNEQTSG